MHTDSSASFTYLASRSASEWTATVWMPISRQARWIRSAISPRLAIRTLSTMGLVEHDEGPAELHRLAVLDEDPRHAAVARRRDRVHGLHRLDDEQRLALGDAVADADEGGG